MPEREETILILDDEENVLSSLRRLLRPEGYRVFTTTSYQKAVSVLAETPTWLVVSDYSMPEVTGIEFLREVRDRWPDTIRVMLTGYANLETAMEAINRGEVYRFVTKPWDPEGLKRLVQQGLEQYRLVLENRRMQGVIQEQNRQLTRWNESLHETVEQRTREIMEKNAESERLCRQLEDSFLGTVEAMVRAVEARDPYTAGHQGRVRDLSTAIAEEMRLSEETVGAVRLSAAIHDLGKIGVPAEILAKPTRLTIPEWGIIKSHCEVAYGILKDVKFPWPIADIVVQHHERYDGSGYPAGLSGENTLLEARILAVADVVEAMASHRPYRPARDLASVEEEITRNRGVLYDPQVVDAFMVLLARRGARLVQV